MSILLVVEAAKAGTDRRQNHLLPFGDGTVLSTALTRLAPYGEGPVVVAISDLADDQEIEEIATANGASAVKGPSEDMLGRFVEVIADYPAEHLVRVTVDSPLVDHHLVADVVDAHLRSGADYTTNSLLRTHPTGLEVEVIRSDALLDAAEQATTPEERAGVTTFVKRRPASYKLHAALASGDFEDHDWRIHDTTSQSAMMALVTSAGGDYSAPWHSYVEHSPLPEDAPPIRLRVARENVAASVSALTDTIGNLPDPLPIGDPSRRSWGVWVAPGLIGAITVSIQNGWGTLAANFVESLDEALAEQILHLVDDRLMADDQVLALTIDGSRIRPYRET